uniref:Col_cuticle_N domain-containing protein n=1 Tax=Steinernema glaseri TaxID=37863 RepID=A0A1I7YLW0_9BILA
MQILVRADGVNGTETLSTADGKESTKNGNTVSPLNATKTKDKDSVFTFNVLFFVSSKRELHDALWFMWMSHRFQRRRFGQYPFNLVHCPLEMLSPREGLPLADDFDKRQKVEKTAVEGAGLIYACFMVFTFVTAAVKMIKIQKELRDPDTLSPVSIFAAIINSEGYFEVVQEQSV